MFCDALTVAAVADELRHKLVGGRSSPLDGGRIQQMLAVDQWVVGMEVYANHQRHYLLLSAQPEEGGRIHLIPEKLRRGLESSTPLLLRLRKCADSGHSWQNEEVTFHLGAAHDLWLHAQGVPGAHVLVPTEGREVPAATLEHAAQLAARSSAARHSNNVPVDYTVKRNVHRRKGGRPGQVIYRGQRTIVVRSPED